MQLRGVQLRGATVFDGETLHADAVVRLDNRGVIDYVGPQHASPSQVAAPVDTATATVELHGGYLCPGFVDLQVNGGGGVMLNDDPSLDTLSTMAQAHLTLGTTALLPTLITDEPTKTAKAIDAVANAIAAGLPLISGLHLEGPHISVAKKGAHPQQHIGPMTNGHMAQLVAAADRLPVVKITLAPESVTPKQITELCAAGIIVSLGHSAAGYSDCRQAFDAGASCTTHLFNAMSPLGSREPGLTGAALDASEIDCGLIVDGHHVSYPCVRLALALKSARSRLFLVSDAMAVAGSSIDEFSLQGRSVKRRQGRLTLEDGTLAGADLALGQAVINMLTHGGAELSAVLAMVTSVPARVAGLDAGFIRVGRPGNLLWLDGSYRIRRIWYQGTEQSCKVV